MRGIHDLRPSPRRLWSRLQPEDLAPPARCPELQRVNIGLGSDRRIRAVRDLLGIRGNYGGHTVP